MENQTISPTFIDAPEMLLAGLQKRYAFSEAPEIANLWHEFGPQIGHISKQAGDAAYGLCHNFDESGFEYMACVQVTSGEGLPESYSTATMPAGHYAVFDHPGSTDTIRQTMDAAWSWLRSSKVEVPKGAGFFERYGPGFNPKTSRGDIQIWYPVQEKAS